MSLKSADWQLDEVSVRSRALFGSPHRLGVALLASLADDEELYAARIASAAGIGRKEAARELERLQRAQLLVPVSGQVGALGRGRPPPRLAREDAEAWAALQALGDRYRRPTPRQRPGQAP